MLEQSALNGPVYMSKIVDGKLQQKRPAISDIKFGPHRKIKCYKEGDAVLVIAQHTRIGYLYKDGVLIEEGDHLTPTTSGWEYWYGLASYEDELHTYFIHNQPPRQISDIPDIERFTLPPSITGYPYDQIFTYSDDLTDLLKDCPATFVDRYKRPLNQNMMRRGVFYPIGIDKVSTSFKDIVTNTSRFPIVVQLDSTGYGMLDLEPGYSSKDLEKAMSTPHIYMEDTPRGGKHFLVKTNTDTFKYRWSPHLELITNTMITVYGINGRMVNPDAPIIDISDYTPVGESSVSVKIASDKPADVDSFVERLTKRNKELESMGLLLARHIVRDDEDLSHGDYMALRAVYSHDIEMFCDDLPEASLPWILAQYAEPALEWRPKHDEYRNKVPYLVYVATVVIEHLNTTKGNYD